MHSASVRPCVSELPCVCVRVCVCVHADFIPLLGWLDDMVVLGTVIYMLYHLATAQVTPQPRVTEIRD